MSARLGSARRVTQPARCSIEGIEIVERLVSQAGQDLQGFERRDTGLYKPAPETLLPSSDVRSQACAGFVEDIGVVLARNTVIVGANRIRAHPSPINSVRPDERDSYVIHGCPVHVLHELRLVFGDAVESSR